MASTHSSFPAVVCAENISLLYLLHSVPVQPLSNEINQLLVREQDYALSFTRERSLVSTLAFLSYTKEDINHIPALCIQENPRSASISVILAVNRKTYEDGSQALQNLRQKFERLFAILSETVEEKPQSTEHRIFSAIVTMCSLRILCRLRLAAGKYKTPKQPIKSVLEEALRYFRQFGNDELDHLPVSSFVERAKDVLKLADSWVKHQTQPELENLIEGIYRLKKIESLQTLIEMIPNRAMSPSSRQNLINIISKVSRYREAARFLYRTSRKFPIVRRMTTTIVNLPRKAFTRSSGGDHISQLRSAVARTDHLWNEPRFDYLCRLLNVTYPQLNDQFALQTKKTLGEAKIHAEIQLIFHCEMNPSELPARVVCSSKDACYLCNAFITMHGKMHTPRSHGRLYPGWRLPLIASLNDLSTRFNTVLEHCIVASLKTIFLRQKKTVYPDPNESTLLSLALSTSTLRTLALSEATGKNSRSTRSHIASNIAGSRDHVTVSKVRTPAISLNDESSSIISALSSASDISVAESDGPKTAQSDSIETQVSPKDPCLPGPPPSKTMAALDLQLVQDTLRPDSIIVARESKFYSAGPLEIIIEYAADDTKSSVPESGLEAFYSIKWLSREEADGLLGSDIAAVVDVEALREQKTVALEIDSQDGLLMMARGAFVRIVPRFGT